jgi:predicted alpha/beta superfamily hydrolase
MKKTKLIFLSILLLAGCSSTKDTSAPAKEEKHQRKASENYVLKDWKEAVPDADSYSVRGNVKVLVDFPMQELKTKRNVWIYLPPDYETSKKKYPVLYMQDGNILFKIGQAGQEWSVDETLEKMLAENKEKSAIVVGVENGKEMRPLEYSPYKKGEQYAMFLVKQLKPYIDKKFRTLPDREHTWIGGASLGAYISLYTAYQYPDVYSKIMAFSPVFDTGKEEFFKMVENEGSKHAFTLYMDIGEKENEEIPMVIENAKELSALVQTFYKPEQIKFLLDPQGSHTINDWGKRFPDAFSWISQ